MMRKINSIVILLLVALYTFSPTAQGQAFDAITPVPQETTSLGEGLPAPSSLRYSYSSSIEESPALTRLLARLPQHSKARMQIVLGVSGDKVIRPYERFIPERAEGYYLRIEKRRIVLAARDMRGLYFGVVSLIQLIDAGELPLGSVTDYPDIPWRGVVEGFYGTPWSHSARLRQLDFYGKNKINIYIYGPKDDPYHSSPHWRDPYPTQEAQQISELTKAAVTNGVSFYWAIHPGKDIQWNETDRLHLLDKFEHMYQLGVRGFALFFDDISGEGTRADMQSDLLNYINRNFVQVKTDVAPLIICPTEYNKSWANIAEGYLPTLGERLDTDIKVMWTGNRVVTMIDKPDIEWINGHIKRNAYIWLNFPVTDYIRNRLLLGPLYGNSTELTGLLSGFVCNPMEQAEASKIAIYSMADYSWNMRKYSPERSWQRAIKAIAPINHDALELFATHSCDLGENGHQFRREESPKIRPYLDRMWSSRGNDSEAYQILVQHFADLEQATDLLLGKEDAPELISEIAPWVEMARLVARYGIATMALAKAAQIQDKQAFKRAHRHAQAVGRQMHRLNTHANLNNSQPGVKYATRHLLPTLDSLFVYLTQQHNKGNKDILDTIPVSVERDSIPIPIAHGNVP